MEDVKEMKVEDVMSRDIITVDKDQDLKYVLNIMKKHDVTKIPVIEEKQLIGIVTDNRIAYKLGSLKKRDVPAARLHASSVMEKTVEHVSPDDPVKQILKKVGEPGLTMLPVTQDDTLLGVVTKADLLSLVTSNEPIQSVMRTDVLTVAPDDRIVHARRIMVDNNVARLPVIEKNQLVGLISDMEVAFAFAQLKQRFSLGRQKHQLDELQVKDYMKTPAVWASAGITVKNAAQIMQKMNVGALPVLKNETLIGIISRTDVLKTIPV